MRGPPVPVGEAYSIRSILAAGSHRDPMPEDLDALPAPFRRRPGPVRALVDARITGRASAAQGLAAAVARREAGGDARAVAPDGARHAQAAARAARPGGLSRRQRQLLLA